MLPLVLGELVNRAKRLPPLITWEPCEPEPAEIAHAEKEAAAGQQFDKHGLKIGVWTAYKEGRARLVCRRLGGLARVLAFLPEGVQEPPWEFWARVFQWFGESSNKTPWKVTWFAARVPREFPSAGQDLGPEHVNGGYTMRCSTDGIFIYREEEVTRVLIHEMVHAACLEEQEGAWTIPLLEAMVEMWAELILIALKSGGSAQKAKRLWVKQSHWIADTNMKAGQQHGVMDSTDYAWRYLSGRAQMYARHGIEIPAPRAGHSTTSLRFTHPELDP